jgi:hypothetical protein
VRKEVLEYLDELVWHDYNMGNSLFSVKLNKSRYLHDKDMQVDLEQLHFWVREDLKKALEELEDEQRE